MKKKVGVLLGGISSEREISIVTGHAMAEAVSRLGYPHALIDVGPSLGELLSTLKKEKVEVALIALHGKYAEDGTIQAALEYEKIPYSGSGVAASALSMNKILTKQICSGVGVASAKFISVNRGDEVPKLPFEFPVVVKPNSEGSSVGLSIVKESSKFKGALDEAFKFDRVVVVEEFIPGAELSVPVFRGRAVEAIEIVPKSGCYDYESKYTTGATDYYVPARISSSIRTRVLEQAYKAFTAVGCRQYGRVDFKLKGDEPYLLEINTLPGCTPTSLTPKALSHHGITFDEFIGELIETSRCDY